MGAIVGCIGIRMLPLAQLIVRVRRVRALHARATPVRAVLARERPAVSQVDVQMSHAHKSLLNPRPG